MWIDYSRGSQPASEAWDIEDDGLMVKSNKPITWSSQEWIWNILNSYVWFSIM